MEIFNIMQIDQYRIYSLLSSTENKSTADIEKILLLVEDFSKICSIEQAKEFLKTRYNIKNSIQQFALGANSFLTIKENSKKYSVRISYIHNKEKECVIYNYKK